MKIKRGVAMSNQDFAKPKAAERIPSAREFHGDTYIDEYA